MRGGEVLVSRAKIATTACLLASGLFVAGAGGAVAFADPESGAASDSSAAQPNNPVQHPLRDLIRTILGQNATAQPGTVPTTPGTSGTGTAVDLPPVTVVGDGRGGMPRTTPADGANGTHSNLPSDTTSHDAVPETTGSGEQPAAKTDETPQGGSTPTESQTGTQAAAAAAAAGPTQAAVATSPAAVTQTTVVAQTTAVEPIPAPTTLFSSRWWTLTLPSPGSPAGEPLVGDAAVPAQVQLSLAPLLIGMSSQLSLLPQYLQLPDELKAPIQQLTDVVTGLATAASQLPFAQLTLTINLSPSLGSSVTTTNGSGGGSFDHNRRGTLPGKPPVRFAPVVTDGGAAAPQSPPPPAVTAPSRPPASSSDVEELTNSYRMGYTEYLRAAGTWKVAAVALPGVTGMMVMVGAGGLLGYRQARATQTVRSSGTARFAR
jgi:hypothetical protein